MARRRIRRKRKPRRKTYKKRKVMRRYKMPWNPQAFKVKRSFDYLVPAADLSSTYGVKAFLSVQPSTTVMAYSPDHYTFQAIHIPEYVNDFGRGWDQYKMTGVKLTFTYLTPAPVLSTSENPQSHRCQLALVVDYDDESASAASNAGWETLIEKGRTRVATFPSRSNKVSIFCRPKCFEYIADNNGTQTAKKVSSSGWIDGNTTWDAEFYGILACLRAFPTQSNSYVHAFSCRATYYVKFKNRT